MVGRVFLSQETALPSPLGRAKLAVAAFPFPGGSEMLEAQVLGIAVSTIRPRISMADAGHYSDCCGRRWLEPRARLQITQSLRERGSALTHPRGRCSTSFPRRPAKIVLPLCSTHARRPAISSLGLSLREQLAGPPGASGGGEWDGVWRSLLTCDPWAQCFSFCLYAWVVDFWVPFTPGKPGRIWFHRDKATKPFAGCLAL